MGKGSLIVISVVLLLTVTIGISGLVLISTSDVVEEASVQTESGLETADKQVTTNYEITGINNDEIFIRNLGRKEIDVDAIQVFINDQEIDFTTSGLIQPQKVGKLTTDGIIPSGSYDIKYYSGVGRIIEENIEIQSDNVIKGSSFGYFLGEDSSDIILLMDASDSMQCGISSGLDCRCTNEIGTEQGAPPWPGWCDLPIEESRLEASVVATKSFVDLANPAHQIGIVHFNGPVPTASVLYGLNIMDDPGRTNAKTQIDTITNSRLSTYMGDGLMVARNELLNGPNARDGVTKVIILLSDGAPDDQPVVDAEVAQAVADNVIIHTILTGTWAVAEAALQQIADDTGGIYQSTTSIAGLTNIYSTLGSAILISSDLWTTTGAASIGSFGGNCFSNNVCAQFTGIGTVYQELPFFTNGAFEISTTAMGFSSGGSCGSGGATNDVRIRVEEYNEFDVFIQDSVSSWASSSGSGWVTMNHQTTTDPTAKWIRVQFESSDCTTTTYVDDTFTDIALP